MLVAVESADSLVRAIAARGALPVREALRVLLALSGPEPPVARIVLERVLAEDARLVERGGAVHLAEAPWSALPLARARCAVVDLETAGLGSGARIVEAAVVVLERGHPVRELELELAASGDQAGAVDELLACAGHAVLCGHNLRFDLGFLDRELRAGGVRVAAPVLDTLRLARRLLAGRTERLTLADLCELLGTSARPEHRALADARATAELLTRLLSIAGEWGARSVGDVLALARARSRPGEDASDAASLAHRSGKGRRAA